MKAIRQIIDYLRQRGELTTGQMSELAALGLVEWDDLAEPATEAVEEPAATAVQPPVVEAEDEVPVRRPGRKGHGRRPAAAHLTARELCRRLAELFAGAESKLAGLVRLAQHWAPCSDWPAAAVVVRQAAADEVAEALAQGLGQHTLTLPALWDFVAEEEFRTLVPESDLQGPVGTAYRALLAADDATHLGRHAALLHHDVVQTVFNLRMAQRKVVRAWRQLYDAQPELVGQFLQREHHWLAWWSMVILYTARRGQPGNYPPPAAHEDWPRRPFPDAPGMYRAWAHAAFLDPPAMLRLLNVHQRMREDRRQECLALRDACSVVLNPQQQDLLRACRHDLCVANLDWAQLNRTWEEVAATFTRRFGESGIFLFGTGAGGIAWDHVYAVLMMGEWCPGWARLAEPQFTRCCFLCPTAWERHDRRHAR